MFEEVNIDAGGRSQAMYLLPKHHLLQYTIKTLKYDLKVTIKNRVQSEKMNGSIEIEYLSMRKINVYIHLIIS